MNEERNILDNLYLAIFTALSKLTQDVDDLNRVIAENPKKALKSLFFPTFITLSCLTLNGVIDSIFVSEWCRCYTINFCNCCGHRYWAVGSN